MSREQVDASLDLYHVLTERGILKRIPPPPKGAILPSLAHEKAAFGRTDFATILRNGIPVEVAYFGDLFLTSTDKTGRHRRECSICASLKAESPEIDDDFLLLDLSGRSFSLVVFNELKSLVGGFPARAEIGGHAEHLEDMCRDCIDLYFKNTLERDGVACVAKIRCPRAFEGCDHVFSYDEIKRLSSAETFLR